MHISSHVPIHRPQQNSYTPESFAVFDEIEKQAHGSSSPSNSSSLGPVARARALVLSTALQSTAAASPARQQVLLAQLVQVCMCTMRNE
jgi:hypothetical protein